jgi:hypothetical protein
MSRCVSEVGGSEEREVVRLLFVREVQPCVESRKGMPEETAWWTVELVGPPGTNDEDPWPYDTALSIGCWYSKEASGFEGRGMPLESCRPVTYVSEGACD